MKRKPITLLALAMLVIAMICCFAGCEPSDEPTPGPGPNPSGSIIKSVTAKEDTVTLRVGEKKLLTLYYDIAGTSGSLTAAQKACDATIENSDVLKLAANGKTIECVGAGESNVTITAKEDETKSCTFKVIVKEVYFERDLSKYSPEDNLENELPADGGYIVTSGMIQGDYFIKGISSTKWFVETEITYIKVDPSEDYPKVGITTTTGDYTASAGTPNNMMVFFLDIFEPSKNSSWRNIGVCEVQNATNWAWNATITNATARHNDAIYSLPEAITANQTFKMAVARDGFNFHIWVNDAYVGSIETLHDLFGIYSEEAGDYVPVPSMPGFFEFNSEVKFANYSATADEATVDAKIASITEILFNENWAAD